MFKKKAFHITAITIIFIALYATSVYAQYNGECWALDYLNAFKISGNKVSRFSGFSQPLSMSINPKDGSVWVADTDAIRIKKLSSAGKELITIDKGFTSQPISVAVDPKDGSCWAATESDLFKFSADGKQIMTKAGFNEPFLMVNPANIECWIADSNKARIVRLSSDGTQLGVYAIEGITQPKSISINPDVGTVWIMDPFTLNVVKISADGKVMKKNDRFHSRWSDNGNEYYSMFRWRLLGISYRRFHQTQSGCSSKNNSRWKTNSYHSRICYALDCML